MDAKRLGVLVGVDRSEGARRALDWAAADAVARGTTLTVVHVVNVPLVTEVPQSTDLRAAAGRSGQEVLDEALGHVRRTAPDLTVETSSTSGNAAAELLRLAGTADEVVLGSHGHGGFASLLLGSTAAEVAAHAPCPVVVVRREAATAGPVVVGADASERGEAALEYAFEHASRHRLPLHALHLCPIPAALPPYALTPVNQDLDLDRIRDEAGRVLGQAVDRWSTKHPNVPVERIVRDGAPARGLIEASRGASLLVVGSHGHGGFAGMLLGSVSQAAIRHAHCPVAVAR